MSEELVTDLRSRADRAALEERDLYKLLRRAADRLISHRQVMVDQKSEITVLRAELSAIKGGGDGAFSLSAAGLIRWADEEIAEGRRGIRWVMDDKIYGRPTDHDCREYLLRNPNACGCPCDDCNRAPPASGAVPVAWLIDWPDEPELGHYLGEEPNETARSRPLYTNPPAPVSRELLEGVLQYCDQLLGDVNHFASYAGSTGDENQHEDADYLELRALLAKGVV